MSESPPPPAPKHPREFSHSGRPINLLVNISLLPPSWNQALTTFFSASGVRARLYFLLASLARHQAVRTANAMAFDLFLALVPMLGLAGYTASLILRSGGEEFAARPLLSELTPSQIDSFIGQHFQALAAMHLAPLAALAGWWLVSSAFNTMIGVFEETFECEQRTWYQTRLLSLGFALLAMILLGGSLGFGVIAALAPDALAEALLGSLRSLGLVKATLFLLGFGGATSFLAFIYRYSIHRPSKKRKVWAGALIATFLGVLATVGLGYYAAHIARYALFYGGLAAIVVVLIWLWLWSSAILIGAEINVALEDVDHLRQLPIAPSDPLPQFADDPAVEEFASQGSISSRAADPGPQEMAPQKH
jgi:membrane protein